MYLECRFGTIGIATSNPTLIHNFSKNRKLYFLFWGLWKPPILEPREKGNGEQNHIICPFLPIPFLFPLTKKRHLNKKEI